MAKVVNVADKFHFAENVIHDLERNINRSIIQSGFSVPEFGF